MADIRYWNRAAQRFEIEKVYGASWMDLIYGSPSRALVTEYCLTSKWLSRAYGAYKSTARSARAIPEFIKTFAIPMDEYEATEYRSFNDFFIRKFRPGQRPFVQDPSVLAAFAEARYFAFASVDDSQRLPVKGIGLSVRELLGKHATSDELKAFDGGPAFIARLCPVDYHRYHFPCDGRKLRTYAVPGLLHSVNPLALAAREKVFAVNERVVSILDSPQFGKLAFIEVGALCVGRIIETHKGEEFKRGDEKGYFLFGGSTVIVVGEKGRWTPDDDLLEKTRAGTETLVKLGDRLAAAI